MITGIKVVKGDGVLATVIVRPNFGSSRKPVGLKWFLNFREILPNNCIALRATGYRTINELSAAIQARFPDAKQRRCIAGRLVKLAA